MFWYRVPTNRIMLNAPRAALRARQWLWNVRKFRGVVSYFEQLEFYFILALPGKSLL